MIDSVPTASAREGTLITHPILTDMLDECLGLEYEEKFPCAAPSDVLGALAPPSCEKTCKLLQGTLLQVEHSSETLLSVVAMRRQEELNYFCCDYFYDLEDDAPSTVYMDDREDCSSAPCDSECRQVMFYWMIKVVDYFPSMHRETVAYAMSYLDRFLQTPEGAEARRRRSVFQLAAVSCLYTSIKIHEHAVISAKALEKLSQEEHTTQDLERMETTILQALQWKLNTPTALTFLRYFLDLTSFLLKDDSLRDELHDLAKFQTEVALGEYKYVTVNNSCIAYCSLMNSLEAMQVPNREHIGWFLSEAADIDGDSFFVMEIQAGLALDCHADHTL